MDYGRVAAIALAASLVSQNASAMPMTGAPSAAQQVAVGVHDVRGPCGSYRCPRPHSIRYCWYWRWQPCPPYRDWQRRWW